MQKVNKYVYFSTVVLFNRKTLKSGRNRYQRRLYSFYFFSPSLSIKNVFVHSYVTNFFFTTFFVICFSLTCLLNFVVNFCMCLVYCHLCKLNSLRLNIYLCYEVTVILANSVLFFRTLWIKYIFILVFLIFNSYQRYWINIIHESVFIVGLPFKFHFMIANTFLI